MEDFSDDKTIILQIRVYFSTLEVTKITETKKWDTEDIMVGLGGTLSLFLGISIVAVFEYAELLLRLIVALFTKYRTRKSPRTNDPLPRPNQTTD